MNKKLINKVITIHFISFIILHFGINQMESDDIVNAMLGNGFAEELMNISKQFKQNCPKEIKELLDLYDSKQINNDELKLRINEFDQGEYIKQCQQQINEKIENKYRELKLKS